MRSHTPTWLGRRLGGLLPTDPEYAPFGIAALRGLGLAPLALAAGIGLVLSLQRIVRGLGTHEAWWDTVWRPAMTVLQFEVAFVPLLVFVVAALNLATRRPRPLRLLATAVAVILGAVVYAVVWGPTFCVVGRSSWAESYCVPFALESWKLRDFTVAALWGASIAALLWFDRNERESARALVATRLARIEVERQETEAQLRTLQAQIEPHFLFNTLAHVQRFQQVDARQGRAMLGSLIEYMRAALPQMRAADSTLRRELSLVRAYVHVQQIRMGERLRAEFDVPEELLDAQVPPMLVLTLAENAVKHGLSPKRDGGSITVTARRRGDGIEIEVADDGVGLSLGSGSGTGLANTRARLAALHGAAAALEIGNRDAGPGVQARVRMPFVTTPPP